MRWVTFWLRDAWQQFHYYDLPFPRRIRLAVADATEMTRFGMALSRRNFDDGRYDYEDGD